MDSVSKKHSEGLTLYKLILRCAAFAGIFCVVSVLMIILTSVIFYNTINPTVKTQMAGFISLYTSAFITSLVMTRVNKEKWLFGGLILGAMLFLLTLIFTLIVNGTPRSESILPRTIIAVVCVLGAFLGRKRENVGKRKSFQRKIG